MAIVTELRFQTRNKVTHLDSTNTEEEKLCRRWKPVETAESIVPVNISNSLTNVQCTIERNCEKLYFTRAVERVVEI